MKKIFTLLLLLSCFIAGAQSTTFVISQVYGAGGNSGATLNADYVELHNVSGGPLSLDGLSIQYASAANSSTWTGVFALPNAVVPAGGYYLIQMSTAGTNGAALPTPDAVAAPSIAMAAANGKVALVNGIVALPSCPDATIIDLVGYGSANCSETSATPAISSTTAVFRINNGCTDTNNNSTDFITGVPDPKNSSSAVVLCGTSVPDPEIVATPTALDFGNVTVGNNSPSQSFSIIGTDLTGFPGDITITSSGLDFELSSDDVNWASTATISYSSATLSATNVYVRFVPQSAGTASGTAAITGGNIAAPVIVTLNGNGVAAGVPNITATSLADFGTACINATVGPNSFDLTGTNLSTADVTVGPLAGFEFATSNAGPFTVDLTISQPGGAFSQTVYVRFVPTAAQNYSGNIPVDGGGLTTAVQVAASGIGENSVPSLTTGAATAITTNTATAAGTITNDGCSSIIEYGIEYSTTSGFTSGTSVISTNIAGGDFTADLTGLTPATTYYYRSYATNSGGTGYGTEMSFTTAAPPPPSFSHTTLADFGSVCVNTASAPASFDLTGTNLTNDDITVGPLDGFTFSETSTGTYTTTLTLTPAGGTFSGTVWVKFTPETASSYDGNIPVTGGGLTSAYNVAVTGSGSAGGADVLTTDSSVISHHEVVLYGQVSTIGCGTVSEYGIEYSSIAGFTPGVGNKVISSNIDNTTGNYSVNVNGLVQNTRYYFRAYAISGGITTYGDEASVTTKAIGPGLIVYGNPIKVGSVLHYTLSDMRPGHYSIRLINSVGQVAFQHDVISQVSFVDDYFVVPSYLASGVYTLQVINANYKTDKQILIVP